MLKESQHSRLDPDDFKYASVICISTWYRDNLYFKIYLKQKWLPYIDPLCVIYFSPCLSSPHVSIQTGTYTVMVQTKLHTVTGYRNWGFTEELSWSVNI